MYQAQILSILVIISAFICMPLHATADGTTDSDRRRYEAISGFENKRLYNLGLKHTKNNPDSALLYYDVLTHRYSPDMESVDAMLCADAMVNASKILYDNFSYSRAMEMLLKCRKICEKFGFQRQLISVYRMMGNIYSRHNDFDSSIDLYDKSLSIAEVENDTCLIHMALSNLIGANLFNGNIDKASEYYRRMKRNRYNDPVYAYDLLVDGALLELFNSNYKKGIDMLKEGGRVALANGFDVTKISTVNSWIAQGYHKLGKNDSTLYYLHENERLAKSTGQNDLLAETLHGLSEAYQERGDRIKALKYMEEYLNLSEQVFDQKKFNSLKNTQFQYELDKSYDIIRNLDEQRIRHEASMRVQRIIIIASSLGLVAVFVFLIIIFLQKRRISRAYSSIYKHYKQSLSNERNSLKLIRNLEDQIATLRGQVSLTDMPPCGDNGRDSENNSADISEAEHGEIFSGAEISAPLRDHIRRGIIKAMECPDLFCDPAFSIARLAEEVGSNTSYVSKFINETYGMNFRSFLNEYRIKESMIRLADKEGRYASQTIKAIGESVGFKSQSAYIAAFTKFTGMKPSAYQSMAHRDRD